MYPKTSLIYKALFPLTPPVWTSTHITKKSCNIADNFNCTTRFLNSTKTYVSGQLMYLRKITFQLILYACIFQLKDHMVLYLGYTDPDYKTMVFYLAPLLCLREGHFSNRSPGLMLRRKRYNVVLLCCLQ